MTEADVAVIMLSIKIITVCAVVIAVSSVLLLMLHTKLYNVWGKTLEATRCIVCHMVGSEECWNGYEQHCAKVKIEEKIHEKAHEKKADL